MAKLFGTDGIRGVANQYPITPEVALRIGRAVARVLPGKGAAHQVLIGRDTRLSGSMLEAALISGLVSEGADVLLAGSVPTPAVAHLTQALGCDAGVMLTASHNPYTDNGIKIFGSDGFKLNDELEEKLEEVILAAELVIPEVALGSVAEVQDAEKRYQEFASKSVAGADFSGLKIVFDGAHGAGCIVGPALLRKLGAEVIEIGTSPDGYNINEGYGSLHPEKAAELVTSQKANLGVCLDGDADRVIFVDEKGEVVSGDRVLYLCAKSLNASGKLRGNTLVATVMSNLGLRDALAEEGIRLETTAVGDRHVLERMREGNFSLGGENSGHIIFSDFASTGDGIVSALMVLAVIQTSGKTLSELAGDMSEYPQLLVNMAVREKPPLNEVPELQKAIDEAAALLGEDGRTLVRYSGTEKKIRVLVEAKEQGLVESQSAAIIAAVQKTIC